MTADAAPLPVRRHRRFSIRRVLTIGRGAFTQLVRMKVFYFLLFFALLIVGVSYLFSDFQVTGGSDAGEQQLKLLKNVALAAMAGFCMIFAIAGTGLLIPRDVEDRTLYTILCKPVSRLEYLLGKFTGVIMLIGVSVLCMDLLFCAVLHWKTEAVVSDQLSTLEITGVRVGSEEFQRQAAQIMTLSEEKGLNWNLQAAVLAIFLKSTVLTAVALLISTFATSTLFTIMAALGVMIIGHAQDMAREYVLGEHQQEAIPRLISGVVALIFPDFKTYDIVDRIVDGAQVPAAALWQMSGLTVIYIVIYMGAAWFVFADTSARRPPRLPALKEPVLRDSRYDSVGADGHIDQCG